MAPQDRIALVTGTSAGIGAATARVLLDEGWSVIGVSRRPVEIDDPGYRHVIFDLGDTEELGKFADEQLAPVLQNPRWQCVGLVNNAAVLGSLCGLQDVDPGQLAKVFAVNAVAPIFLMGFMARIVSPRVRMRVVNISSGAATQGLPGLADYCASKAALRLAGLALAAEFDLSDWSGRERGAASVLCYEPGVVDTNMQDVARATNPQVFPSHQAFQDFAAQGALHRPKDVVGEIVGFLAGDTTESYAECRYGGP